MKAYKIFSITPSGALRSYNISHYQASEEHFSSVLLKYEKGKWRKPEIAGTGIFCLNEKELNYPLRKHEQLWEVEAEGQIGFEELIFDSWMGDDDEKIKRMAENKRYASPRDIGELLFLFPSAVVFNSIKPIRKV